MKKFYSWKSLVKSSLHGHNWADFIVISFLQKVIPGHSFHKIVRFYIFVLEESYSKTGMEVTGVSLCVLF